jgi:hypothetical protein
VLVAPDNIAELTASLTRLIGNSSERAALAAAARAAAAKLPTWDIAGQLFSQALDQALGQSLDQVG